MGPDAIVLRVLGRAQANLGLQSAEPSFDLWQCSARSCEFDCAITGTAPRLLLPPSLSRGARSLPDPRPNDQQETTQGLTKARTLDSVVLSSPTQPNHCVGLLILVA